MGDWVAIARLGRPHGVRGEIKAWPFDEGSETLFQASRIWVKPKGGDRVEHSLARCRASSKSLVLTIEGIDSRDKAEALNGATIMIQAADLPELAKDEFYHRDLVGMRVERDGEVVGKVARVEDNGGHDTLLVRDKDAGVEFMVPFVDAMVDVDVEEQVVRISPPEGLIEATTVPIRGR